MQEQLSIKNQFALGLLMLALFLGAGNLIFPPQLGQDAGSSILLATLGFLLTAVGLPLLAIMAISLTKGNMFEMAKRVHPIFSTFFAYAVYLALGPFFGIPRTSTVTHEIAVAPFLPSHFNHEIALFISTFVFFGLTFWLALNPLKLIDSIGKRMMPILLGLIGFMTISTFFLYSFDLVTPALGTYVQNPFSSGFIEGYLTMDTIAALVFGIVIMDRLKDLGIHDQKLMRKYTIHSGLIAGAGLSFVYISLALLGTISVPIIGRLDNGGQILSELSFHMYQYFGLILLAVVILVACLTTAIGLVSACSEFFAKRFPQVKYSIFVFILTFSSFLMANLGLNQLISISLPVLIFLYPIAIVLIVLTLIDDYFKLKRPVFITSILITSIFSFIDGLEAANIPVSDAFPFLRKLPLFETGMGWLIPTFFGAVVGFVITTIISKKTKTV
ncbi:branched-chain amino acid transport system II carrier protein [Alkalihalobacillus pseudalcaliphilus]|uniref:branched-chain amino acid transport system II carrier protein n=1 Tax=Alkalihalobacillus pseudalcaliphilus TaxID=79884 RepID=UPI00064DB164|nr:branched-chain amino acid transport system II carrier protein [Alkalihalobacillus pseudalcaliphilus]KMK74526.1 branched-chain amino acid transporter [Alkalihalobacillus pseudalcaliphilus]